MTDEQAAVLRFHRIFDIHIELVPKIPPQEVVDLRKKLILEELNEFIEAANNKDIIEVADGLADLLYVIYGAACAFGIDLQPVFWEVHRSNMSKLGGYKREDGKLIKPDTYSRPDIKSVLRGI